MLENLNQNNKQLNIKQAGSEALGDLHAEYINIERIVRSINVKAPKLALKSYNQALQSLDKIQAMTPGGVLSPKHAKQYYEIASARLNLLKENCDYDQLHSAYKSLIEFLAHPKNRGVLAGDKKLDVITQLCDDYASLLEQLDLFGQAADQYDSLIFYADTQLSTGLCTEIIKKRLLKANQKLLSFYSRAVDKSDDTEFDGDSFILNDDDERHTSGSFSANSSAEKYNNRQDYQKAWGHFRSAWNLFVELNLTKAEQIVGLLHQGFTVAKNIETQPILHVLVMAAVRSQLAQRGSPNLLSAAAPEELRPLIKLGIETAIVSQEYEDAELLKGLLP